MNEPHRHFHAELAQLKERVLHMSSRTESALLTALDAFQARRADIGVKVVDGDQEIDRLEIEIEERVTNLLALHQPLARDLRLLLAVLKISNDLERVGDHAVNIAKSAQRLGAMEPTPQEPELVEMASQCRQMLSKVLDAFVHGDAQAAREVCRQDDAVDDLHRSLFQLQVSRMSEDSHNIDPALERLLVSRNLERVADLTTNIAEDVVFMVEGATIKHGAERG